MVVQTVFLLSEFADFSLGCDLVVFEMGVVKDCMLGDVIYVFLWGRVDMDDDLITWC